MGLRHHDLLQVNDSPSVDLLRNLGSIFNAPSNSKPLPISDVHFLATVSKTIETNTCTSDRQQLTRNLCVLAEAGSNELHTR